MSILKHLILCILLFSSCIEFYEVKVVSIGKITLEHLEGNNADVNVNVELDNSNFFGIKIKPSSLDVYIEQEFIGKARLKEKIKIDKKAIHFYDVKIQLQGDNGVLRTIVKYALKKDLNVRIKGYVLGSVYGIPKKVFVDETKTIDGNVLKMKIPFLN